MEGSCSRGQLRMDVPPACGLGEGPSTHHKKKNLLRNATRGLGTGRILWIDISNGKSLLRPRRRWEDNIKMHLREMGWERVDWMHLAQDGDQWRDVVNTVMNLRVP
jgi:hypothetical protein